MARKGSSARGGTPATAALTALSIPYTLHRYRHQPSAASYGHEAAEALDVAPARVFKTLVAVVDDETIIAVVPVSKQLDLKALSAAAGAKRAVLADPSFAERVSGYVVGGISPLGQRKQHRTVVDASALDWPTVYVSAGRRGLEIEVAPSDLIPASGATVSSISR